MQTRLNDKLISWGSDIDPGAIRQAEATARLPVVTGHVALMPDAHVGIGATVGSVIPTTSAIIPAAVGVDLGCGMAAVELDVTEDHLPDDLTPLLGRIEEVVPAGIGKGHRDASRAALTWFSTHPPPSDLARQTMDRAPGQYGTLGSGNHFVEVCVDERRRVWVVLHSGSRGAGNRIARAHIAAAKRLAKDLELRLEDPDLAFFLDHTPEFDAYIADMLWSQDYAAANRSEMMSNVLVEVLGAIGTGRVTRRIDCHHNFTASEIHNGTRMWITRKGAIRAGVGDLGVIPGSMGTSTYIVEGKGNEASWKSCSHGAGRRFSRSKAKEQFSVEDLATAMAGKTWLADRAGSLVDEIPGAYKDISMVMADQADLVKALHLLHQVLNYKGT